MLREIVSKKKIIGSTINQRKNKLIKFDREFENGKIRVGQYTFD